MRPPILLTRPQASAERFAVLLQNRLGPQKIVISPLLQIEPLMLRPEISPDHVLIFTSAHAVGFGRAGARCYVVGRATARAAEAEGMSVLHVAQDARSLIRRILADGETGPLLHLRGEYARGQIAQTLSGSGCKTAEAVVYAQRPASLKAQAKQLIEANSALIVPLFSPRTARIFSQQVADWSGLHIAALSPAVAEELTQTPRCLKIAHRPDAEAMLLTIKGLMDAVS